LVFVDGLAIATCAVRREDKNKDKVDGATSPSGSPTDFFSPLFPHAVIDVFSFLDDFDTVSVAEWRLHQRGRALLEQLCKRRQNAANASFFAS
jgi:hypothetical protein